MKKLFEKNGNIYFSRSFERLHAFQEHFAFADESSPGNVIVKSIASKEGIAGITFAVYAYDAPDFEPMGTCWKRNNI